MGRRKNITNRKQRKSFSALPGLLCPDSPHCLREENGDLSSDKQIIPSTLQRSFEQRQSFLQIPQLELR